jgi:hypothetical protein
VIDTPAIHQNPNLTWKNITSNEKDETNWCFDLTTAAWIRFIPQIGCYLQARADTYPLSKQAESVQSLCVML